MMRSKTVMDVLNLWKDDPEELLLDLGFGRDEPDLSGRIPARFINYQSQARGVNLQVFLAAQKNRLDLENPDVSNRFRELEVLQHVTTTLCSLVVSSSSSPLRAPLEKHLSPQARERRRRIGLLFRRASKKSLCQTHNQKTQEISPPTPTCALQPRPSLGEEEVPLERVGPAPQENGSPLADGEAVLNPHLLPQMVSSNIQERALKPGHLTEGPPLTGSAVLETEESPAGASELNEMEEVSVDPPCSEMEFSPAPSSTLEYLDPRSSSPELHHVTFAVSSVSASSWSMPAGAEDKDAPYPYLSTLPQDLEEMASPTFTIVPPSPSQNFDHPPSALIAVPSAQSDSSSGNPGDTKSDWTEVWHELSPAVSGRFSSLLPSAPLNIHRPSYFGSSFSDNKSKDSVFSEPDGKDTFPFSFQLDTEGSRQTGSKGQAETQADTWRNQDTADQTEGLGLVAGKSCNQTEMDPRLLSYSETKQEELNGEITGAEGESQRCYLALNTLPELHRRSEAEPQDSVEAEGSDLVLETCVDGVEGEAVDVEAFLQQLETEGRVYWAEPVRVWDPTNELKASSSSEASFSDSAPSLSAAPFASLPANSSLKPAGRSVSVQMPSSLSSHIVQRRDVPYVDDSKRTSPLPGVFTLDISNPFRAVQEWTDVQIQRSARKSSRQTDSREVTEPTKASEMAQRSTLTFPSSQSFPLTSTDSQLPDVSPGMVEDHRTVSGSGGASRLEERGRDGNPHEENLWEGNQAVTTSCCCSRDHHSVHRCCAQSTRHLQHSPFPVGDLEEVMLCLQHFRSVHSSVEEQLCEDQASVYGSLSNQDREKIQGLEVLRHAVEQEVAELEMHLNQFAHNYDDSLKRKMQRLLDEQSLLCSQLFLPGAGRTAPGLRPKRTVSVQCCLLPWTSADVESDRVSSWSTWSGSSPRHSPSGSESSCKELRCFSES